MTLTEIILAVLMPPLAVALRQGTSRLDVAITFLLWVCGWLPGVIYALRLVTTGLRDLPGSVEDPFARRSA